MDPINQQSADSGIEDALSQIKEWQAQGKKEDAIAGCKEILEVDPENKEAKNILASYETHEIETPEPPTDLKEAKTEEIKKPPHGIVVNLIAILLIIVIIGGGIFAYLKFFNGKPEKTQPPRTTEEQTEESEEEVKEEETIVVEEKTEAEIRNDQRLLDLQTIEGMAEKYFEENGSYPDGSTLETLLGEEMPYDPLDGETDESGNMFVYSYASYGTEYILAGLFEEEEGNTIFTTGASVNDHPNYRDSTSSNVLFITSTGTTEETTDTEPKVKVKR